MNRTKKVLLIGMLLLLLCGCDNEKESTKEKKKETDKTIVCKFENEAQGVNTKATYTIYYGKDIVNKVKSVEIIETENEEYLEYMENTLESTYKFMDESYGGYDYSVKIKNNVLTSTTTINYKKLNVEKMLDEQPTTASLVNEDNKITLDGLINQYETIGAKCDNK